MLAVAEVFLACDQAVGNGVSLRPPDPGQSGSPFQNWFEDSLRHAGLRNRRLGKNSWPDFVLEDFDEGYELKGLIVGKGGRWRDFDANSRLPKGTHEGRQIFYVFGRYPRVGGPQGVSLSDLVICEGSFLSREGQLVHKNTSVDGAGSYGDMLIRIRKMFVPRTPFRTVSGTIGHRTLIVPASMATDLDDDTRLQRVGQLERVETAEHVERIKIDLAVPGMHVERTANAYAGNVHRFVAYRRAGLPGPSVEMAIAAVPVTVVEESDGDGADG
jgi:hypothetical protein